MSSPTLYFCMTSRASLEWPTSSNSSVASLPDCSKSTSSPPGCCKTKKSMSITKKKKRSIDQRHGSGRHTSFRNSATLYTLSLITIHGCLSCAFSRTSASEYFLTSFSLIFILLICSYYWKKLVQKKKNNNNNTVWNK